MERVFCYQLAVMETEEHRSWIMSQVRSKDTAPEMAVRRLVYALGYRYRLHEAELPGTPDLVFPGRRKVIFVHGCFWHSHDCKRGQRVPSTRQDYWMPKLARNRERDARNGASLEQSGWSVMTIWECQIKDTPALAERINNFLRPTNRKLLPEGVSSGMDNPIKDWKENKT